MADLKNLRDELRNLRKEHVKPVSRMRKGDISAELDRLRKGREETAAAAAVPSAPLKKSKAAVETIKEAKSKEFPVKPTAEKSAPKKAAAAAPKKKSKMDRLMAMMNQMSDTDEE